MMQKHLNGDAFLLRRGSLITLCLQCLKAILHMLNAKAHQTKIQNSKKYLIIGFLENVTKVYGREQMGLCFRKQ